MKSAVRVLVILCVLTLTVPLAVATEFEPGEDGPWINVDVYDLVEYGDATFLDYLGKGYVVILDTMKTEGPVSYTHLTLPTIRRGCRWGGWGGVG